jgi:hypothetical protein
MGRMIRITLEQYAMGRAVGFQGEWLKAEENAKDLLLRVNSLLEHIGWQEPVVVSSGFRPASINRVTKGAAKGSLHQIGKAIDILDPRNIFRDTFNPLMNKDHAQLLRKYGLFMEHPDYTQNENGKWIHLDIGDRVDRPTRTFIPA